MKTIDEAAKEYADKTYPKLGLNEDWVDDGYDEGYNDAKNRLSVNDFRAGVKFAQRWIPVEEELPDTTHEANGLSKVVICKSKFLADEFLLITILSKNFGVYTRQLKPFRLRSGDQ